MPGWWPRSTGELHFRNPSRVGRMEGPHWRLSPPPLKDPPLTGALPFSEHPSPPLPPPRGDRGPHLGSVVRCSLQAEEVRWAGGLSDQPANELACRGAQQQPAEVGAGGRMPENAVKHEERGGGRGGDGGSDKWILTATHSGQGIQNSSVAMQPAVSWDHLSPSLDSSLSP